MTETFDINQVPAATRKGPATWGQIRALSFRLCGSIGGKPNTEYLSKSKAVSGMRLRKDDLLSIKLASYSIRKVYQLSIAIRSKTMWLKARNR